MLHQRQSVYFIHKKHIQPNQSVFAAWFQQHSGGRTPSGWFFLLRLKTAAEQQLHENSVSVRSDCVKTEDPEDTNKKLLYFKVSTCVLIIKSWRAFPQVSRNSVFLPTRPENEHRHSGTISRLWCCFACFGPLDTRAHVTRHF